MGVILVHTTNKNLLSFFQVINNVVVCSDEKTLFAYCTANSVSAYVISYNNEYAQRAINTIRKNDPYVPIVVICTPDKKEFLENVDLNYHMHSENEEVNKKVLLNFIESQIKLYSKIKSLTPIKLNEIYFGDGFKYETEYREIFLNDISLRRFSTKEGKILEILSENFGKVVKRDAILEEVWNKTDIYSSRSFDVYVSRLRNFFKEYGINLKIRNISGVGLMLE